MIAQIASFAEPFRVQAQSENPLSVCQDWREVVTVPPLERGTVEMSVDFIPLPSASGYKAILNVQAKAGEQEQSTAVANDLHGFYSQSNRVLPGATLTDTVVAFSIDLSGNDGPFCMDQCSTGQLFDGAVCFSPPSCSGGQFLTGDSKSCICPAGQLFDGAACFTPPSCTGGQNLTTDSKTCECPAGQLFDGAACFTPASCTGGQVLTTDSKSCECPAGQLFDGAACFTPPSCTGGQSLTTDSKSCECPAGQLFDGAACFTPPSCTGGQNLTSDSKSCECPAGQSWNNAQSLCATNQPSAQECKAQCRVIYPHGNSRAYRDCVKACSN